MGRRAKARPAAGKSIRNYGGKFTQRTKPCKCGSERKEAIPVRLAQTEPLRRPAGMLTIQELVRPYLLASQSQNNCKLLNIAAFRAFTDPLTKSRPLDLDLEFQSVDIEFSGSTELRFLNTPLQLLDSYYKRLGHIVFPLPEQIVVRTFWSS
jgi:hypothetical protein